jgi:phosphate transport system permease protein
MSVPLGLLVAIYITEYGGNALATAVRFLVDVMTGIPSIVAGLFVLAFWIIALNQPFTGASPARWRWRSSSYRSSSGRRRG